MISSLGEVLVWLDIWEFFTAINLLGQFVSRTETPIESVEKIWTWFPSSEIWKRVGQVWELGDLKPVPLQKAA